MKKNSMNSTSFTSSTSDSDKLSAAQQRDRRFNELVAKLQANLQDPETVRAIQTVLCEENQGLIISMVKQAEATGKPSNDAIQYGFCAFLEGLRWCDPSRGIRPSTYISLCILNAVREGKMADNPFGSSAPIKNAAKVARAERALSDEGYTSWTAWDVHEWLRKNDPKHCLSEAFKY